MKNVLWLFCLATSAVWGEIPNLSVQNLNFVYNDPVGTGTVADFSYGLSKDTDGLTVEVEKIVQDFRVRVSGTESREFLIKTAPRFIQDAKTIELRNLNANLSERVSLSLGYGTFISADDTLLLKDLLLSCDKILAEGEASYIQGCIQKLNLKSSQFSSDLVSEALTKAIQVQSLTIKSIDLKMVKGKFDLSAEIKAQISGQAKGFGNVSYDPLTKNLTIKISEVKFGFFDLTSQVFAELKKQESATLKVKKPYIYYHLE